MAPHLRAALIAPLLLIAPIAAAQDPPAPPAPTAPAAPVAPVAPPASPPGPSQLGPPVVVQRAAASRAGAARAPRRTPAQRVKHEVEVLPPPGTPIASSPGFARLDDGTSRIWVEVTRKVEVLESKTPGRVVYRLRGTAVLQRTNQLPLLTGFFATPVDRVQLAQQGPDLDLIIELREVTDLTHRVVETPRGMVLQIDFPKSTSASVANEEVVYREHGRVDGAPTPAPARSQGRQRRSQTLGAGKGARRPAVDEPVAPVQDN